jgi:DnaJ-class molecular chaperone
MFYSYTMVVAIKMILDTGLNNCGIQIAECGIKIRNPKSRGSMHLPSRIKYPVECSLNDITFYSVIARNAVTKQSHQRGSEQTLQSHSIPTI